jgi:hypothetical protein
LARAEIKRSAELNPSLAETHIARSLLLWSLKETAATGFPNYLLFARDPYLDRIRKAPEFVQFMSEQKSQWERYRQEFAY